MPLGKRHVYSLERRPGHPSGPKIYIYHHPSLGNTRRVGRKLGPYFERLGLSVQRNLNDRNCMRVVELIRAELDDRDALPAIAHDTPILRHIEQHCDALAAFQRSPQYIYGVRRRLWATLDKYYPCAWKRRDTPPLAWRSVAEVNKAELNHYLAARSQIDSVGPHDMNHDLRAWRGFGSWLERMEILPRNPLAHMQETPVPDELPKVLTPEQMTELLRSAMWAGGTHDELLAAFPCAQLGADPGTRQGKWRHDPAPPWLAPTLILLMYTGMRPVEVSRLVWENIDLEDRTLVVKRKRGKHWVIPLASELVEYLDMTDETARIGKVVPGFPYNESRKGPGNYWRAVRTAAARAGLPGVTLYWLRISVATHLASVVSLPELQLMMGHRSYRTTDRYVRLATSQIADVPDRLPWHPISQLQRAGPHGH